MKKILALFLSVALIVPCFANVAFAASTDRYISSIHFTLDTSKIDIGDDTDSYDHRNVPLEWDKTTDQATYGTSFNAWASDGYCANSSSTVKVGDVIKMKYSIEISGKDKDGKDCLVNSSTNISVSMKSTSTGPRKASISKSRTSTTSMTVTITLAPVKGAYTEPTDVLWSATTMAGTNVVKSSLGQATWKAPENGNNEGIYDIRLKRDDKNVYTYTGYNATSFNFYPWMTKEGDYVFEVRSAAVASGSKNSDWASSDSQYVAKENISDGSGQGTGGGSGSTSKVGWQQVNGIWYYIFPDGTMKKNGWEKISNKWYHFDASGAMQTGWITINNETFYLDTTNGDMKTGWVKTSDGQWYYLTPAGNSGTEGAMVKNNWVDYQNKRYYMSSSGAMCTGWTKIGNDQYYFFTEGDNKGAMATNQRIDSFWVDANGRWVKGQ